MDVFMGAILPFGFNYAPQGWATCDGQMMGVSQNAALFSLLGTTYGGNGQTTFGLPDLRGRTMIHQGQGASTYVMGQNGGTENAALNANNMPTHNHPLMALDGAGTADTASGNVLATASFTDPGTGSSVPVQVYAPAGTLVPMAPGAIGSAGNSQPFPILQPYLTISLCIALQGIYPSRS